jgi:hypothetical protein
MMIPLVYTFASRDRLLSYDQLNNLLEIRDQCRQISFRQNPSERLTLEKIVSQILLEYFQALEDNGKIKDKSKPAKIAQDLEFIDDKLTELQAAYNEATEKWNRTVDHGPQKVLWKLIGFRPFQRFTPSGK